MKKGDRVGAILGSDGSTVQFLGYGVYDGDFIPHGACGLGPIAVAMGRVNPRITLDNGKVVWGCECWWGPEDEIKAQMKQNKANMLQIVNVDIDEIRKKS